MAMKAALLLAALLALGSCAAASQPVLPDVAAIGREVAASKKAVKDALAAPEAAFEAFLAKHLQLLPDRAQPGGPGDSKTKAERLAIFTANLAAIDAKNAESGDLLSHGIGPFTHLEQAEFEAQYLDRSLAMSQPQVLAPTPAPALGGRRLLAPKVKASPALASSPSPRPPSPSPKIVPSPSPRPPSPSPRPSPSPAMCTSAQRSYPYSSVATPSSVDWVAAGRTSPIRNQASCGSCVAFASSALAEFHYMSKFSTTNTTTDVSEQDLLECTSGDGCGGQYLNTYVDLIGCRGQALESAVPYLATNAVDNCRADVARTSAMSFAAGGGWAYVPLSSAGIAQALTQSVVQVSVDATNWSSYSSGIVPCGTTGSSINHAVVAVGFFDNVPTATGTINTFLIRNSWGSWWGSGNGAYSGHIYLQKDCANPGPYNLQMYNPIVPLYG